MALEGLTQITSIGIATGISLSGVTTISALSVGSTQVVSNTRQLQNIASLDATTTATIETAVANAPNTFTDLQVTGLSTFTNGPVLIGSGTSTGTATQRLQVTGGAYVSSNTGIATTNPTSRLHVVGDALITGVTTATDFNSTSDIKLKTNIQAIESPLSKVMQLNGVSFNWKENDKPSLGVIAQDVEKVLPELVGGGETKTVNYNGLVGLLIECIKEQQQEINMLKEKL
jgi:Chaperone of endosialidase